MTPPSGASPLRPQNQDQHKNLSTKENQKPTTPSRWSGQRHHRVKRGCGKRLLELATKR